MAQLFVSDLHLEDTRPDITRAFFHLLDSLQGQFDTLYLLGDIFEVWLGDDTPSHCADQLADRLRAMADTGIRVFLLHGNRDFLVGSHYAARCGAQLVEEPVLLRVAGQNALLMHGDVLCTQDTDYQAFRNMVRDPTWQQAFLAKSLDERIAIGRHLRDKSQQSAKEKADYIMDVTQAEVVAVMAQHQVSLLIHGHTHRPATHSVQLNSGAGTRMVLGDWYQQGWYILADDHAAELKPFPFTVAI